MGGKHFSNNSEIKKNLNHPGVGWGQAYWGILLFFFEGDGTKIRFLSLSKMKNFDLSLVIDIVTHLISQVAKRFTFKFTIIIIRIR